MSGPYTSVFVNPLETLIVAPAIYGAGSLFTGADRPEMHDAAAELKCGHLPIEACACR